ncbi:UNKNOWN [Stylonychia lemnae]|uniref:Uncharacterized protein n=1 Tax=Stylonychia lemnae TaxID=5949 RepID=A0A078B074_STYLE|nr:UNKNOWN [Stylonychia lemnae]|eukprot:CDW86478.1 UNKNOWN [Stylonychia lemnae]
MSHNQDTSRKRLFSERDSENSSENKNHHQPAKRRRPNPASRNSSNFTPPSQMSISMSFGNQIDKKQSNKPSANKSDIQIEEINISGDEDYSTPYRGGRGDIENPITISSNKKSYNDESDVMCYQGLIQQLKSNQVSDCKSLLQIVSPTKSTNESISCFIPQDLNYLRNTNIGDNRIKIIEGKQMQQQMNRRESQASIHQSNSKLINIKYMEKVVTEAALKGGLKNITKTGLKELGFYCIEYFRIAIEELIDVSRSYRNQAYLTNKNHSIGQTDYYDMQMEIPPQLKIVCTGNPLKDHQTLFEIESELAQQKAEQVKSKNEIVPEKPTKSSGGKRQAQKKLKTDEQAQHQKDTKDFSMDEVYLKQNRDTISMFTSSASNKIQSKKENQQLLRQAKDSDSSNRVSNQTNVIYNSKSLYDNDLIAMQVMPQRRVCTKVLRQWLIKTRIIQPQTKMRFLEEIANQALVQQQ